MQKVIHLLMMMVNGWWIELL